MKSENDEFTLFRPVYSRVPYEALSKNLIHEFCPLIRHSEFNDQNSLNLLRLKKHVTLIYYDIVLNVRNTRPAKIGCIFYPYLIVHDTWRIIRDYKVEEKKWRDIIKLLVLEGRLEQ